MTFILILLAIPGVLAVLLRLGVAAYGAAKHTIEWYVARQITKQRAERGDLSGLAEAEKIRNEAGRQQRRWGLHALAWTTLLAFPLMIPGAVIVYPLYSLLWLLPRHRITQTPTLR
jgi:hypothetical protein